jgi:hypothetical protein
MQYKNKNKIEINILIIYISKIHLTILNDI